MLQTLKQFKLKAPNCISQLYLFIVTFWHSVDTQLTLTKQFQRGTNQKNKKDVSSLPTKFVKGYKSYQKFCHSGFAFKLQLKVKFFTWRIRQCKWWMLNNKFMRTTIAIKLPLYLLQSLQLINYSGKIKKKLSNLRCC